MKNNFEECLDILEEVVRQACTLPRPLKDGTEIDSMCIGAYRDAIQYLIDHGRLEQVGRSYGKVLCAKVK